MTNINRWPDCGRDKHLHLLHTFTAARVTHVAGQRWHYLQPAVCLKAVHAAAWAAHSQRNDAGTGMVPIPRMLRDWRPDLQRPALQLVLALDVPVSENDS